MTLRKSPSWFVFRLNLHSLLIGTGFILLQGAFFEITRLHFGSPALSLIVSPGLLLLASAIGGLFHDRLSPLACTLSLWLCALTGVIYLQSSEAWSGSFLVSKILMVGTVVLSGFLMGFFFPRGLQLAKAYGATQCVPALFGINILAGAFGVPLGLVVAMSFGYVPTVFFACLLYALAALCFSRETT